MRAPKLAAITSNVEASATMALTASILIQYWCEQQKELKRSAATKREDPSALDLTSIDSPPPPKRIRRNTDPDTASSVSNTVSLCSLVSPCSHEAKEVKSWSVEDVCKFVGTVELCQPFVEVNIETLETLIEYFWVKIVLRVQNELWLNCK